MSNELATTQLVRVLYKQRLPNSGVPMGVRATLLLSLCQQVSVRPCPKVVTEPYFAAGAGIARLRAERLFEVTRRAVVARGSRGAGGLFRTNEPRSRGFQVCVQLKDSCVEEFY